MRDPHYQKPTAFDEALSKDPHSIGFCTFAEFRKNPDKYRPQKNQLLTSIDNGIRSENMKKEVESIRYYLEGYRCDSTEAVEKTAIQMGLTDREIVLGGIVREKVDNGKERLHVHMMSKANFEKRKSW